MLLLVEVLDKEGRWNPIARLKPGEPAGSLIDRRPTGAADVIMFQAFDDFAAIYRSKASVDLTVQPWQRVTNDVATSRHPIATLMAHESATVTVNTDQSGRARTVRFSYV